MIKIKIPYICLILLDVLVSPDVMDDGVTWCNGLADRQFAPWTVAWSVQTIDFLEIQNQISIKSKTWKLVCKEKGQLNQPAIYWFVGQQIQDQN